MLKVSSEKVVADHNIFATTMSLDDNQSIVSLAGKQSIYLINVDQPNDVVCMITRSSKYDVTSSEFDPKQRIYYALSSNNNIEIYSFEQFKNRNANYNYHSYSNGFKFQTAYDEPDNQSNEQNRSATLILRAHTRTITDLNWCPFSYDLLATCSIDTFIHIFDVRETKRPSLSLTSIAGTNQVKWNKMDENLIATSHDVDVRVWDIRKGNNPLHYIAAHNKKIYCLDWHPSIATELATCSQDNSVKFWDLNVIKNKAESYINTNHPVWRAKYTPLANGVITSQLKQNLDHSLWLWNTNALDKAVYSFVTPQDLVIDFHFRTNRSQLGNLNEKSFFKQNYSNLIKEYTNFDHDLELENDENTNTSNLTSNSSKKPHFTFELVSWSKDKKLRVWNLDESLSVIDCDTNQLIKYTNRYLQGGFKQKSIIGGEYIKNLLKNEKKDSNIRILNESHDKNGIKINRSSNSNPLSKLNERYSSSNVDLKELLQSNKQKKIRKFSANAISPTYDLLSPTDLEKEFGFIDKSNFKNLKFEKLDSKERYGVIQAKSMYNNFIYRLKIVFTIIYPDTIPPIFDLTIMKSVSTDEKADRSKVNNRNEPLKILDLDQARLDAKEQKLIRENKLLLLNKLQDTAHMQVKRNRPCLEPCLKEFMAQIDEQPNTININANDTVYSSFHDAYVPFPSTCGARFSGPNLLICFSRPTAIGLATRIEVESNATPTPKALSALSHNLSSNKKLNLSGTLGHTNLNRNSDTFSTIFPMSVSSFYTSNRSSSSGKVRHKSAKSKSSRNWKCVPIYVYNVEKILPCNKYLAANYIFDSNPIKMCTYNAEVAAKAGRKDHLNTCILDIQMAAMLVCCFSSFCSNCKRFACSGKNCQTSSQINNSEQDKKSREPRLTSQHVRNSYYRPIRLDKIFKSISSPYHTIGASAITEQNKSIFDRLPFGHNSSYTSKDLQTQLKSYDIIRHRSNSWSDIAETNGSISDLTVIESNCSVNDYGNSPSGSNNFRSIGGGSFVNNVFNLDQCMSCQSSESDGTLQDYNDNQFNRIKCEGEELMRRDNDLRILNVNRQFQFDCIKQMYADLLFSWGLLEQRCSVLNYVKIDNNYQQISQYTLDYSLYYPVADYNRETKGPQSKKVIHCSVCHIRVKGLISNCLICHHGGHLEHLNNWFKEFEICPTGCGCRCSFE